MMPQEQISPSREQTFQFEQKVLLFHDPPFIIPVDAMFISGYNLAYLHEPFLTSGPRYIVAGVVDEKHASRLLPSAWHVPTEAQARAWITQMIHLAVVHDPFQPALFVGMSDEERQKFVQRAWQQVGRDEVLPARKPQKYWYKDVQRSEKLRWTRALFLGWTEPTEALPISHAIFRHPSGRYLLIADNLLTQETRALLLASSNESVDREAKQDNGAIEK